MSAEHDPGRGVACFCAACWQNRCIVEMDRVEELEQTVKDVLDRALAAEKRAEAAEAAHKEAAAQWQNESRLRRAAEAKLVLAAWEEPLK